jgi:hypothetical protein
MFQTALVDEDIQNGFSTVLYMPGHESEDHESWYINMGIVTKAFLDPHFNFRITHINLARTISATI